MAGLKVPIAVDEAKNLVRIEDAEQGKHYFCPACGVSLVLKHGDIKVPHFAHKASETCNQETITHKTAKLLVQQAITEWKLGKAKAPIVQRECQICGKLIEQPLPDKVEAATLEHRVSDGFVADVALLVNGTPEAAIEILVTHTIGEKKAEHLSIPFIEIDGFKVLKNPTIWKPTIDRFRPLTCSVCSQDFQRFQEQTAKIAKQTGIELPTSYYRYGLCSCWRCHKQILVFTWPERSMFEKRPPTKEPRPKTISFWYSKTAEDKYWANTCPYCHELQGDWFLYMEPEGAFCGLDCGEDTPDEFRRDLMQLAHWAFGNDDF